MWVFEVQVLNLTFEFWSIFELHTGFWWIFCESLWIFRQVLFVFYGFLPGFWWAFEI